VVSIRGVKTILCNIYKSEDVILNRVDGWSFSSVLDFSTYEFFIPNSYQNLVALITVMIYFDCGQYSWC